MTHPRHQNRLHRTLAWLLPALALIGILTQLIYLWFGLPDLQGDWQVVNSLPAVKSLLDFDAFLLYVLALRWLATVLAWLAAFVVFRQAASLSGAPRWAALFTALLMALLPGVLLSDMGGKLSLPAPWDQVVMAVSTLQGGLAILGLLLFGFLFPNLRFVPGWVGWMAVPLSAGVMLMLTGILGSDDLYVIIMMGLLALLLAGAASQVYRYLRRSDAAQRRQTVGVVAALVLLPLSFIVSFVLNGSGWPSLINLHVQILIAALVPIALLDAVLSRGLWSDETPAPSSLPGVLRAGVFAASLLGFVALAAGLVLPLRAEKLLFEPLPASAAPRPVIIDTDMAPDDWLAILFLLQRPDIEVKAITVTGAGEVHCSPGVQNALGLAVLSGNPNIPVACGRETPIQGQNVFPEDWRKVADEMAGLSLPVVEPPASDLDAVALIAEVLEQSPQKVTLLALGPLTNLADGLQKDPGFLANAEMVYVMGGAINVMGNVGFSGIDNQVAEWNIYIDPMAAQIVFESGAPLTLVPLDATNQVPMDMKFYRLLRDNRHTPEADFVYRALQNRVSDVAGGMMWFWDPLAAGLLADESLGYIKEGRIKIYPSPGPGSGLMRLKDDGALMRYAVSADRKRFEMEFLRTLNQP